ncbi:MAG: T9SS type A sorting domain-containing protein [Flavobacteriaceae bacterium]
MKKLLICTLLFFSFQIAKSQQENLFDTRWYATEMVVGGNTIPIPVLTNNQPEGCFVGIEILSNGNDTALIDIALCWACSSEIHSIDSSSFIGWGNTCLLCIDCGPCDPDGTATICNYLSEFESNQYDFYEAEGVTFTYTITPLPGDHLELKIEKPNGDYIIYGTESTLSITENEFLKFSIVPNPSSSIISLTGLKSDVTSLVIYSLNGIEFPLKLGNEVYDISHLAAGLYFISVTSVDGQKAIQKLIKY